MRKWSVLCLFVMLPLIGEMVTSVRAQQVREQVAYSQHRHFFIPYTLGEKGRERLKQLQLFVSTDRGKSWKPVAVAPPEQEKFSFISERDGTYWFTVQTLDTQGKYFPPNMESFYPGLKVVVDTMNPLVSLRQLNGGAGKVAVGWNVTEEYPDDSAFRLQYRAVGSYQWKTVNVLANAKNASWNPQTNAKLEVRVVVKDLAGNVGEDLITISPGGGQGFPDFPKSKKPSLPKKVANNPFPLAPASRNLVNSRRISLNYEIKDKGPSGVSNIELWFTMDGRSWNKYPLRKFDGENLPNPLLFEVNEEGVYGFTIIARSGVGLSQRPPQIGDEPQVWVEVDVTTPVVDLQSVIVGRGAEEGKLAINWAARDKNLSDAPISISYAEQLTGPWSPVVQNIANSGHYIWSMPRNVPYQFYVRVEAADKASNVGSDVTDELVKVDLSQPKVSITNVQPAGQ